MAQSFALPQPDYQRIYQVVYSVLEASGIAVTHRACIFFAAAGTMILREHYRREATISAGCMALMVDEQQARVVVYGREESAGFVNDAAAFHAWVECDGWLIDFMAPIMGDALLEDGHRWHLPRQMLQKRIVESKATLSDIQELGDFFIWHQPSLAEQLIDRQPVQFIDLLNICLSWYRPPPGPLNDLALADSHGPSQKLVLRAPSIVGVW
jgi:hypothetical protein